MSPLDYLGALTSKNENRIEDGQGTIYAHTIDVGETSIAIDNIGSLQVVSANKNHGATILGIVLVIIGLLTFSFSTGTGTIFLAIGGALIWWNLSRQVDVYLSIGTCDGRSTIIVSKDIKFLNEVRGFIREKIETKNANTATINITNSTLTGTVAVGAAANAQSN